MTRHDYAFPFRIGGVSHQAAQAAYAAHVDQMIRQVLLTSPGERADLPDFGCGLRQALFVPLSDALVATTQTMIRGALSRWLGGQIQVHDIVVQAPNDGDDATLLVQVSYVLIETQSSEQTSVRIL